MACMITFKFQESAVDIEKPSHPSHDAWYRGLVLLRALGRIDPHRSSSEYSYCCFDRERPDEIIYLYPHCSEKKFKAVQESCASKSKLARTLTPILREPLSATSVSRYEDELDLVYPALVAAHATKHLELITLLSLERQMVLMAFLEPYCALSSLQNMSAMPVKSCSTTWLSYKDQNCFACIEWKSVEDRAAVLSDALVRKQLKSFNAEFRVPFVQELGKTEDDLTWEENFDVYLRSTGAKDIQHRFVTGKFVTDEYLGLEPRKSSCVIA